MSLQEIQDILYRSMGLNSESVGSATILHAVNTRMESSKLNSIEDYLEKLKSDKSEIRELIEEVVIPETWFFRDREPFEKLSSFVKDEWLKSSPDGPLRVLSMPCATGEEPYSIAMALIDSGLTPSQVYIDAVDISHRNINRCWQANYRKHSFRGVAPEIQKRFFKLRDDNLYHPDILIKAMVNFKQASILDAEYINKQQPYDIVFCRNLLIYFDSKTQLRAINMLDKLLKPAGILFTGHAETSPFINSKNWNNSIKYKNSFALRKFIDDAQPLHINLNKNNKSSRINKTLETKNKPKLKPNNLEKGTPHCTTLKRPIEKSKPTEENKIKNSADLELQDMNYAKQLADKGEFIQAESICFKSLEINKQDTKAYFLLALLQLAMGDKEKSAEYFHKVIYLEPRNIDALLHLATLTEQLGDAKQSQQLTERAQRCKQQIEQKAQ